MKLTAALLALTFAVSASAQTPTAKPAAKTATPAAKPATGTVHATPNGPSNIPIVHGIKKPLYALSYIDISIGSGPLAEPSIVLPGKPTQDWHVMLYTVQYTGWLAKDGKKFDSSFDHPNAEPITFPEGVHQVIPGWDDGFAGMRVGGKRRIFIPYQLAYGDQGKPPVIPAKADLIFDVELVGQKPYAPPPPPAPPAAQKSPTTPAAPSAPKTPAAPAAPAPTAAPAPAAPAKPATK